MSVKSIRNNVFVFLGFLLLPLFVRALCMTLKINVINNEGIQELISTKQNFILGFWHGKMFVPWFFFRNKNITALISKSKDGEILSRLLNSFNYNVVRGSSNDGGKEAFEKMLELARNEKSLAITVDGPKGPIKKMKAGAVVIAQRSETPLFLLGVGYNKFFELRSWDRFQIPKPFTKVNLLFSNQIDVNKTLTREEITNKIKELEILLNELDLAAEKF